MWSYFLSLPDWVHFYVAAFSAVTLIIALFAGLLNVIFKTDFFEQCFFLFIAMSFWPVTFLVIFAIFTFAVLDSIKDGICERFFAEDTTYFEEREKEAWECQSDELIIKNDRGDDLYYEIKHAMKTHDLHGYVTELPVWTINKKSSKVSGRPVITHYKVSFDDDSQKAVFLSAWNLEKDEEDE